MTFQPICGKLPNVSIARWMRLQEEHEQSLQAIRTTAGRLFFMNGDCDMEDIIGVIVVLVALFVLVFFILRGR